MVNTQNTGNKGGNVGNQGGQRQGEEQKFVSRFEMAIMQFVILNKAKQGGVTRENLQQVFRGNLQMGSDHLQHCIQQLVSDGHLKEEGNRYTITDDGREDVQKLQHLVMELPSIVNEGGQGGQQRQGVTQQQTTGGMGSSQGSGSTGQTTGNAGNFGSSSRGVPDTGEEMNRGSVNKGGATRPAGQKASEPNQGQNKRDQGI